MFKRILWPFFFLSLLIMLVSAALQTAVTPQVQANVDPATPATQAEPALFALYEAIVVRAYYTDQQMLNNLAAWNEPWEVHRAENYAVVEVTAVEYNRLLAEGYHLEVDEKLTALLNEPRTYLPGQVTGIPGYPCYRTVEETFATAASLAANYPHLVEWLDVGDSWEKINSGGAIGYDMMVLKLTNSAIPGPKPAVFIMSSMHAREYTPAELSTRFAEYLIANYGVDADVTWLLDYHEFHLMLQANPDGRKWAEQGLFWRKNTNNNYCANTNSRGADLNRNYSFSWNICGGSGCSSGSACSDTYRGPIASSEPETQSVENYVRSIFPDQRDDPHNAPAPDDATGVFLDIHSYSELVLWPWGFTATPTPNGAALQTLGRKFAYFNGYYPEQAIGLYPTDGTTDDFAYGDLGLAAYTFELGTSFFQSCGVFENTIMPGNMPALLYAGKAARTPYLTPAGPEVLDVALSSTVIEPATLVTLTAVLDDTRFSALNGIEPSQNIVAAEYYINTPPWITTTTPIPYPLTAADGSFNQPIEAVTGVVDSAGLGHGRHTLFVHGQDADGNWGPVSAIFLYVLDPAIAPTITGQVRAADTNQPLAATVVTSNIFEAATDPGSGLYSMLVLSGTHDVTAVPESPLYAPATAANVIAHNYQTVTQDFYLYPYCPIFSDDVESGNLGWTTQFPWAITTEASHSPTHSWTDSPGGNYANNRNVSLTSPIFDLTGYSGIRLNYWQICDTEAAYDFCYVEVSTNGGANWQTVAAFDGRQFVWEEVDLPLSQLDGASNARIRFRFFSDVTINFDGWHVDDIVLYGAGPACVTAAPPIASFTTSSPTAWGETTEFTNTSLGTDNDYLWDFGDSSAPVTTTHPVHTYAAVGSYTVTLTVTNFLGTDTATGTVVVLQSPLANFTTTSPIALGDAAVFNNTSLGTDNDYLWDFGDGSATVTTTHPVHIYAAAGSYTVTLTVANLLGSDIATATVAVLQPPLASFTAPLQVGVGQVITPTNSSTGDELSFAWDFGDGSPIATTLHVTHTFTAAGTYTITLTVSNPIGVSVAAQQIVVVDMPVAHHIFMPMIRRD